MYKKTHGKGVEDERVHRRVSELGHEAVQSLPGGPVLHGLLGLDGAGRHPGHEDTAADGHEADDGGGEHGHVHWDTDAPRHTAHMFYPESDPGSMSLLAPHPLHMRTLSSDPSLHSAAARADKTTWFFRRIMDIIVITYFAASALPFSSVSCNLGLL